MFLEKQLASENVVDISKYRNKTPSEIKNFLDDYVIGQDSAKITFALAVYNHYKKLRNQSDVEMTKSNVLLIGPTGSGKTLLAQSIAKLLNVPFAIADATSLTEAGYVGDDVETILQRLYNVANGDIEKAERGIIFLDEVDKIAKRNAGVSVTRDVSGEGVQQALLKIIEGSVVNVPTDSSRKSSKSNNVQMDTSKILFICAGAFVGLEDIVSERLQQQKPSASMIGFGASFDADEPAKKITEEDILSEDLVKFGLIPEFIGRIPVVCKLDELDVDALKHILIEPKNALLKQYQELFAMDGCSLEFSDSAIEDIARQAYEKKTGARGLKSIVEKMLKTHMFTLPEDVKQGKTHLMIECD
jgi:ATP-dependent Clp protease ATP-binding subunit ClpX